MKKWAAELLTERKFTKIDVAKYEHLCGLAFACNE
jgi:hypothetical protein